MRFLGAAFVLYGAALLAVLLVVFSPNDAKQLSGLLYLWGVLAGPLVLVGSAALFLRDEEQSSQNF